MSAAMYQQERPLDEVVHEAREACAARGHDIGWFPPARTDTDGRWVRLGVCRQCHDEVFVVTRPAVNEVYVSGQAVACGCDGRS